MPAVKVYEEHLRTGSRDEYVHTVLWTFLNQDISTINANSTWTTGSDWIDVRKVEQVQILCKFTGSNASQSGVVVFNFICLGNPDQGYVPTVPSFSVTLAPNGTNTVIGDALINVLSYGYVKLFSIQNTDASYSISNVNAQMYIKYKSG